MDRKVSNQATHGTNRRLRGMFRLCSGILLLACSLGPSGQAWAQGERLKRSISLMNASRTLEAEQLLRTIGPDDGDFVSAQTYLGYLLLKRGASADAEEAFRTVLSRRPDDSSARLGLGIALMRKGMPSEAGKELEPILLDPEVGPSAQAHRIESLFYSGNEEQAFREAERLAGAHPSFADAHRLLGFFYQVQRDTQNSLRSYLNYVQLAPDDLSAYLSVIAIYRSQKDWDSALRWARRALALDDNHPLLYQELAEIYRGLGRAEESRAASIESERTYEAELLYIQAINARVAGRSKETEAYLRKSTETNPRLAKAWIDLGDLLQRERRFAEASRAFRSGLEHAPEDARAILGLVQSLQSEGKEAEAASRLERAASAGTLSPDILTAHAANLLKQGKAREAAAAAMQAVVQQPDDPDLLYYLGYVQQSGGRNREALAAYSAALRLHPTHVASLVGQAQARLRQGDAGGAVESFLLAQKLDPSNAQILRGLTLAYRKAGDVRSAESVSRACLSLNPGDAECREQLAFLRMEARDYKDAVKHFELLSRSRAVSKSALDGYSFALMRSGEYRRAIEAADLSLERFGPDAVLYTSLGFLNRCVGNLPAAADAYRHARDLSPGDADRNGDLGLALYLAKDYQGALEPLQAAVRLKPLWGSAHYTLALVYWNLKQYGPALTHARKAQDLGVREARSAVRTLAAYLGK
jgi:tetratricopeptide (TPR) repeat protein